MLERGLLEVHPGLSITRRWTSTNRPERPHAQHSQGLIPRVATRHIQQCNTPRVRVAGRPPTRDLFCYRLRLVRQCRICGHNWVRPPCELASLQKDGGHLWSSSLNRDRKLMAA
jgi:hypothetical protein